MEYPRVFLGNLCTGTLFFFVCVKDRPVSSTGSPPQLQNTGPGLVLLMPLMGSEDLQNLLKVACTMCFGALLQQVC